MNWIVKATTFILFCCFSPALTHAQDPHQRVIDSLQALLHVGQRAATLKRASTLIALGKQYMIRSNYLEADRCYTESLGIAESLNNDSLAALDYRNKSIIYFYQHDFQKALTADHQSLDLFTKLRDTGMIAVELKSIGDNYLKAGDSDRALEYMHRALPVFVARHDARGQASLYANLSMLTHGDMRESIALRLKAKNLWEKNPVDNVLPTINIGNLGEGYLDLVRNHLWERLPASDTLPHDRQQLLAIGEKYLREAIRMAHLNSDVENSSYFTGVLAELEEQKGDFRHAYYDFRAYQDVTDSIYSQENKNKLAGIENSRAIERKNQEIATKELQIGNQHKKLWLMASCIALLAVTGGLLYRQGLVRKRTNAELRRLNAELDAANQVKARFFGILSHDLRSPVSRLVHFLQLQEIDPGILSPEEAKEQSGRIKQSAQALLENMESMLLWSKGQMERFAPEIAAVSIGELFEEVSHQYPVVEGVHYSWQDDERLTIRTDRHYLRSILYNLTSNATQAVKGVPGALVSWRAYAAPGELCIAVTDNGPGVRDKRQLAALFEESTIGGSRTGLGLHIVRDLAKAIEARVEAESLSGGGMRFVLHFINTAGA